MKPEEEVARLGGEMDGKGRAVFAAWQSAKQFADWLSRNRHAHFGVTKVRDKYGVTFQGAFGPFRGESG